MSELLQLPLQPYQVVDRTQSRILTDGTGLWDSVLPYLHVAQIRRSLDDRVGQYKRNSIAKQFWEFQGIDENNSPGEFYWKELINSTRGRERIDKPTNFKQ